MALDPSPIQRGSFAAEAGRMDGRSCTQVVAPAPRLSRLDLLNSGPMSRPLPHLRFLQNFLPVMSLLVLWRCASGSLKSPQIGKGTAELPEELSKELQSRFEVKEVSSSGPKSGS